MTYHYASESRHWFSPAPNTLDNQDCSVGKGFFFLGDGGIEGGKGIDTCFPAKVFEVTLVKMIKDWQDQEERTHTDATQWCLAQKILFPSESPGNSTKAWVNMLKSITVTLIWSLDYRCTMTYQCLGTGHSDVWRMVPSTRKNNSPFRIISQTIQKEMEGFIIQNVYRPDSVWNEWYLLRSWNQNWPKQGSSSWAGRLCPWWSPKNYDQAGKHWKACAVESECLQK